MCINIFFSIFLLYNFYIVSLFLFDIYLYLLRIFDYLLKNIHLKVMTKEKSVQQSCHVFFFVFFYFSYPCNCIAILRINVQQTVKLFWNLNVHIFSILLGKMSYEIMIHYVDFIFFISV